ncbi:MAG: TPM domain-containing protein, partial [Lutibacter sp.]|nr:TPM domain-containing protein [Lutibacter sp.]
MSKIEEFLTVEQEQAIIKAIEVAEKNTSGEIRVHLEK